MDSVCRVLFVFCVGLVPASSQSSPVPPAMLGLWFAGSVVDGRFAFCNGNGCDSIVTATAKQPFHTEQRMNNDRSVKYSDIYDLFDSAHAPNDQRAVGSKACQTVAQQRGKVISRELSDATKSMGVYGFVFCRRTHRRQDV